MSTSTQNTSRLSFARFGGARLMGVALLVAALGSVTLAAWAQPHGGHGMHGGPGMGMMFGGRGLERMLDSVNATTEQRSQIKAIAERAMTDMKAQRESGKATREQMAQLFTQPTVDANAAEALRTQLMQQHDQASRRMVQTMLEVSRVLTPEQRQQIAKRMQERRSMMERRMSERRPDGQTSPR
jgi:Spy/CpxP family protein refolding chaperone